MTDPLTAYAEAHAAQFNAASDMAHAFAAYVRERDERAAARDAKVDAELAALRGEMRNILQALHNVGGQLDQLNRR